MIGCVTSMGKSSVCWGRWFITKDECENFPRNQIPEGKFQWFFNIVRYLQFVMEKKVSTSESQREKVHAEKVRNKNKQSIAISNFKTDIPPILGCLGKVKYISMPLMSIPTSQLWNAHGGVKRFFMRALKSLYDNRIKMQAGINCEFQMHMEAKLLDSDMLGKCGVFQSQMTAEMEDFRLCLVTNTYGET